MIAQQIRMLGICKNFLFYQNRRSFIINKILKKKLKEKDVVRLQPETYTAQNQKNNKKQEKQDQEESQQPAYDFFARQKQIQLNQDFRKVKQQMNIPQDIEKLGFDGIVFWSSNANAYQSILLLVKMLNRAKIPPEIADKFTFERFMEKVNKNVYLSKNFNELREFALFGQKFRIQQPIYWKKIEQKTVRQSPKKMEEIQDCIEIAFIMSKVGKGQLIYSSLANLFKQIQLSPENIAKLLIIYSNTESGESSWVEKLMNNLAEHSSEIKKQIFVLALNAFSKSKILSSNKETKILARIQELVPQLSFKQLCEACSFVGHGKMPKQFWEKAEKRLIQVMPAKKSSQQIVYLLGSLNSYSLSTDFIKNYFLPLLRERNYKLLQQLAPVVLSAISKNLYIYQLQSQTKDIEEIIQTRIIKQFNNVDKVLVDDLINVIKDYTITRMGSRELYIFLQQVANTLFQQIKQERQKLETLCVLYENSELCTAEFLIKLQSSI